MAVKGKSARGQTVDFDLLRIKEQMASSPPSIDVRNRQDFVENRLRRRAKKKVPQELLDAAVAKAGEVEVEPDLPSVEGEVAEMIDETVAEEVTKVVNKKVAPKTKQKARPKAKTTE